MIATPCSGRDRDRWFSTGRENVAACREACFYCPILTECARQAVEIRPTAGVWATVQITGHRDARRHQFKRLRAIAAGARPKPPAEMRTEVNRQAVTRLRAEGASAQEIAEALHLSMSTCHRILRAAS